MEAQLTESLASSHSSSRRMNTGTAPPMGEGTGACGAPQHTTTTWTRNGASVRVSGQSEHHDVQRASVQECKRSWGFSCSCQNRMSQQAQWAQIYTQCQLNTFIGWMHTIKYTCVYLYIALCAWPCCYFSLGGQKEKMSLCFLCQRRSRRSRGCRRRRRRSSTRVSWGC